MTELSCDRVRAVIAEQGFDDPEMWLHAADCPSCALEIARQRFARQALAPEALVPAVPRELKEQLRMMAAAAARSQSSGRDDVSTAAPDEHDELEHESDERDERDEPEHEPDEPNGYQAVIRAVREAHETRRNLDRLGRGDEISAQLREHVEGILARGEVARRRLRETHAALVARIGEEFVLRGMDREQAREACERALVDAACDYHPDQVEAFDVHARQRMRQRLMLDQQRRVIEIAAARIRRAQGREPTAAELATATGIAADLVTRFMRAWRSQGRSGLEREMDWEMEEDRFRFGDASHDFA